jgi:hypothetical protein
MSGSDSEPAETPVTVNRTHRDSAQCFVQVAGTYSGKVSYRAEWWRDRHGR